MKTLLALLLVASIPQARALDIDRMIRVLVEIEGGEWSDPGGAAHMQYSAWSDRSPHAYQLSRRKEYALPVYRAHLDWIRRTIIIRGALSTPKNIALVWRFGMDGAKARGWRGNYGDRASNLYHDSTFK